MYRGGRSQIRPGGSARRGLRRPHGGKVTCQEDHEDRLLLAHDSTRCNRVCEEVRQLLEIWECLTSSRQKDDDHFLALAVRTVGNHYGSPATRKETNEIPTRCNWLIQKVGGSGSFCNNHRNKGTKFCMEKHCLQVRHTKDDHLRQRSSVRQPRVQSFCSNLGIRNKYSSPGHPQANG